MKAPGKLRTWSIPNKKAITTQTAICARRRRKGEMAICLKHSSSRTGQPRQQFAREARIVARDRHSRHVDDGCAVCRRQYRHQGS
ncbi:MAG: hypothetical protein IJK22_08695 [Bacteroidales bacterium]|nr:hypothetical protein [Bacteroidales bacterium]